MVVNRFPPNYKLREARAQRGWTQEAVVEALYETAEAEGYPELKIDSSMISRWECGKQQPQAYHAFLLAKIYGKSVDQMGFVARSRARAGISFLHSSEHSVKVEGVKRRNLMLGMGSMAAPLPDVSSLYPEHWDRLSRVLKNPKGIDETTVTSLESETAVFQRLNLTISSIQLLPHLTSHLDRLSDVLTGTIEPKLRRRLVMTMGEAVELAGWLAWEQGDSVASRRLYQVVAAASHEADYPPLLACCLADMSYASSSRGDASRAEYLISQAMKKLDSRSFPVNYSWLEARQAEELASLGDSRALHLIEGSLHRFNSANPDDETMWTGFLTPVRMDNFALNVYLQLGRHHDAEPLAKRAMESNAYSRLRPVVLADIATLYLKTNNFEQGTEIAAQAFDTARKAQSQWAMGRLNNLRQLIQARAPYDQRAAEIAAQFSATST